MTNTGFHLDCSGDAGSVHLDPGHSGDRRLENTDKSRCSAASVSAVLATDDDCFDGIGLQRPRNSLRFYGHILNSLRHDALCYRLRRLRNRHEGDGDNLDDGSRDSHLGPHHRSHHSLLGGLRGSKAGSYGDAGGSRACFHENEPRRGGRGCPDDGDSSRQHDLLDFHKIPVCSYYDGNQH